MSAMRYVNIAFTLHNNDIKLLCFVNKRYTQISLRMCQKLHFAEQIFMGGGTDPP